MYNKKVFFHILACLAICAVILGFRQFFNYPQEVLAVVQGVEENIKGIIVILKLQKIVELLSAMPTAILLCSIGAVIYGIGALLLKLFPKKMQIGSDIIALNLSKVIKVGLLIYFMRLTLVMVFVYSVVGIPIAIVILAASIIVSIFGNVPVAIYIGKSIQEMANGNDRRMLYNYIIGAIFMLLCINVYAIGGTFLLFVFPVLSFGAFGCILEKKALHININSDDNDNKKGKFNRKKIRDIITNGM